MVIFDKAIFHDECRLIFDNNFTIELRVLKTLPYIACQVMCLPPTCLFLLISTAVTEEQSLTSFFQWLINRGCK